MAAMAPDGLIVKSSSVPSAMSPVPPACRPRSKTPCRCCHLAQLISFGDADGAGVAAAVPRAPTSSVIIAPATARGRFTLLVDRAVDALHDEAAVVAAVHGADAIDEVGVLQAEPIYHVLPGWGVDQRDMVIA